MQEQEWGLPNLRARLEKRMEERNGREGQGSKLTEG